MQSHIAMTHKLWSGGSMGCSSMLAKVLLLPSQPSPSTLHCIGLLCSFKTMRSCVLSEPVYSFILQRLRYLGKRSLCFLAYFYFTIFIYVLVFELLERTRTLFFFFILLLYLHVQCVFIFRQFFKPQHFFIAKFIFWEEKSKG